MELKNKTNMTQIAMIMVFYFQQTEGFNDEGEIRQNVTKNAIQVPSAAEKETAHHSQRICLNSVYCMKIFPVPNRRRRWFDQEQNYIAYRKLR